MDDQRPERGNRRQTPAGHLSRRRCLRVAAGASGLAATTAAAGCSGLGSPGGPNTYLAAPERDFDPSALPYPTHGDPLPNATVPAPLDDTAVSTGQLDSDVLLTFFYSHCRTVCPRLVSTLRNVQTRAAEEGLDGATFLAVTFDPERDTEQRLRAYADRMNVDTGGSWHFLRPEPGHRTTDVVRETFGVAFQKEELHDHGGGEDGGGGSDTSGGDGTTSTGGSDASDSGTPTGGTGTPTSDGGASTDGNSALTGEEGAYGFVHSSLILLANADGYVERAYRETQPVWQDVYDDLATLREREG